MYYSFTFIPYQYVADDNGASVLVTLSEVGSRAQPPYILDTDRNTWEHWRLVPTSRPAIATPNCKTNFVNVPGANGKLDLSQALTRYPLYENRTGTLECLVMNDFRSWQEAYTDIMTTLHNKRMICVYEEDPEYYYIGRWTVTSWKTGDNYSTITIGYDLEPFKYRLFDSQGAWLWNPFNFDIDMIPERDGAFNPTVVTTSVSTQEYPDPTPIDYDPTSAVTWLLKSDEFIGHVPSIEDNIGIGKFDLQNTMTAIVGMAPVVPKFTIIKRDPEVPVNVRIKFTNPEAARGVDDVDITVTEEIHDKEFDNIILTNWTGVNNMGLFVQGDGAVTWTFRPGRL